MRTSLTSSISFEWARSKQIDINCLMAAFRFSAWRPFASLSRLCFLTSSRSTSSRSTFSTHLTSRLLSRPLQRIPVRLYFMKPKKKKGLGLKGMAIGSLALSTMAGFSIIILGDFFEKNFLFELNSLSFCRQTKD